MKINKLKKGLWLIAPAFMAIGAVTFLTPSCGKKDAIKSLNETSWATIKKVSKSGKAQKYFKIGDTKDVKVNGQTHKVRIIGFDQDVDKDGNKIGITFEFENILSDENGYSLATYWENTNSTESSNYDYMNSTIRAVLNGNDYAGASRAEINWFQYFGLDEDFVDESKGTTGKNIFFSTDYDNKSVLSMLPKDLTKALATPSKFISIYNHDQEKFVESTVNDKLFLLSPREMGYTDDEYEGQEASTVPYEYYQECIDYIDDSRIKHQVKWHEGARESMLFNKNLEGAFRYPDPRSTNSKFCGAGYNSIFKDNSGGTYWLRSPYYPGFASTAQPCSGSSWYVDDMFGMVGGFSVYTYDRAYGVAPAFCI